LFSNRIFLYRLFLFIAIILLLLFIINNREKIAQVLQPFVFGVVIAYILNPVVEILTENKMHRTAAVALIYFILIGSMIIALVYILPVIIIELNNLMDTLPLYSREVQKFLASIKTSYLAALPASLQEIVDRNISRMEELLLRYLQKIADGIIIVLSSILSIILGPILGFYFLKDLDKIKESAFLYIPAPNREIVKHWVERIGITLGRYLRSQLLVSLIVGILTTLSMLILNIDFAILIGVVAGLANIIPYFGPIIGTMPAIAIAILRYPNRIPWIIILMLVIHQLESGIISPHIVGEYVGLHPITVIFVLLTGGIFFGLTGLILAVPVAALIKLIMQSKK
jgi:predicted PurR-regulated permease PerM